MVEVCKITKYNKDNAAILFLARPLVEAADERGDCRQVKILYIVEVG